MKNPIKQIMPIIIFVCMTFTNICAAPWVYMTLNYDYANHTYSEEAVYLIINGKLLDNLTMPPIIMNGNTLVPSREVFEPLGAVVDWKKETEEIYIAYGENIIYFKINSDTANINGETIKMTTEAKIINNKTMIPVRVISESLGLNIGWDPTQRIINIDAPVESEIEEIEETEETS